MATIHRSIVDNNDRKISVGVIDDQRLFVKSLATLINTFPSFNVVVDAMNGEELLNKLHVHHLSPDILLVDVNMPVMNGVETAKAIAEKYPLARIVALSMKDDDMSIIAMLKAGCCAYLVKDIHPDELERALTEVHLKGSYNGDAANVNYRRLILRGENDAAYRLSAREQSFLQLACSDLTYKQIASQMHLSERTIDGYRESLFEKMNVQSRVGMVVEGIRRDFISL